VLLVILEGVIVYYHTYFLDWDKNTSRKTAYREASASPSPAKWLGGGDSVHAKFENYVVRLPHTHSNFHRIIEIIDPIRL
jgi:hypothetical protein